MQLPPHTEVTETQLRAIAERHGLARRVITRLPDAGIFNAIYLLGSDHVLRVPREHPVHMEALHNEAIAVPLARAAGVRTPALIDCDDSREILPVPYSVYERVHGETLAALDLEPAAAAEIWREVGHDLALLHAAISPSDTPGLIARDDLPNPWELINDLVARGSFSAAEARWFSAWLERIASAALTSPGPHLLHGDVQTTNIMVDSAARSYVAIIDWGSVTRGDPAWDFAGIPLRAVPYVLEGYREVVPLEGNDTAEARILWRHLQLALWLARRTPTPGVSWAEQPLPMLIEIFRFFLEDPPGIWRELAPVWAGRAGD